MSDKSQSNNSAVPEPKLPAGKAFSKIINMGLLAALGGGVPAATFAASHSVSRRVTKNAIVYVAELAQTSGNEISVAAKTQRPVFSTFGKSATKKQIIKSPSVPHPQSVPQLFSDSAALQFLKKNNLLSASSEIAATTSGEINGRKVFTHEAAAGHCHTSGGGTIFSTTNNNMDASYCVNFYGGTWEAATNKPFVTNVFVQNNVGTGVQLAVTVNQASTVFGVIVPSSAVAPTTTQVIAGTDGSGNAAVATGSQAVTSTGTVAFTGLTPGASYTAYLVARNGSNVSTPVPFVVDPKYETGIAASGGASWKFAKVRTNANGDFYVAYSNSVTGGISFVKWNGTGFSNYASITPAAVGMGIVGTGWGNDQNVDYEVDASGNLYVVFNGFQTQWAVSGDPHYGFFNGTSWSFAKIAETGDMIGETDVFLDSANKVHASFRYTFGSGQRISYATNLSGSWVMTNIATGGAGGTDEIHDTHTVVDSTGVVTVIYKREDNQNNSQDNYYIASSSTGFTPVLLLNGKADLKQYYLEGLAVDASNKLHYAYANQTDKTSFYVTNASGSWVQTPISKGAHADITVTDYERVGTTNYFVSYTGLGTTGYFMSAYNGSTWVDGVDFKPRGGLNDRFAYNAGVDRMMFVTENSGSWISYYHSGKELAYLAPSAPNNAPTDISLTTATVNQSGGANAVIGTLGSVDADSGNTHTYSLVAGAGDTDNASFNISGSSLRANNAANLAAGTYSIRIRTTDNAAGTFEKVFSITVVDNVVATVSSIALSGSPAATDTSITFTVTFNESVSNVSTDDFQLTATGGAAGTIANVSGSGTTYTVTVNTISGNGTLRLDLKANTNIVDAAGNGNNTNGYVAAYTSGSSHTVAIPTAPTAPTIGTATAGDGQVSVTFTAPGNNGGSAITGYTVTANPGGITATGSSSPIVVTGLTNGVTYTFTVTATNTVGTGTASAASNSATPKGNQTITFTNPGTQSFGTTPTLTASTSSSLVVSFTSSTTGVCTITSGGALTFVAPGTCTINADQAGDTVYNAASTVTYSFTVAPVVPAAPTIGTATAGDTQATITFTAPATNGGATITGYTVTSNPGGATGTGGSSPITVTGLTNGVAYTFTVTATTSAGTGSASAASNSVTPAATQTITFANPGAQNFGTSPTLAATSDSGLIPTFTSSTTGVCTVTSSGTLTFISAGTCTINADQGGNSSFLPASTISRSFTINAVAPGAPAIGTPTAGDTQASVTFSAPSSNGGAAITTYTVTVSPADVAPVTGSGSPIVVTGLTNGQPYTFTVTATNSAGTGSPSSPSSAVTPATTQTITFNNPGPQNFGSTPTLSATSDAGLTPTFSSATTSICTITSSGLLSFIGIGTCTINADQSGNTSYLPAGQVSRSFTVNPVLPGAPVIGTATAGDGQASVTFSAPSFTGGTAITGYTVTSNPGGITANGAGSPITITGLTNGQSYTFTVTATNSVGTGGASGATGAVTPLAAQTITFADPGAQQFGTSPTLSASTSSGLAVTFSSSTTSVCTVTSAGQLSFLAPGTCSISAAQTGNASHGPATTVTRTFTVNAVVPGAPVIGTATAGDGQASVTFSAPAFTGGTAITGYTVTSNPGGITATGAGSPITITGLTNGQSYTFSVTATNAVGAGSASAASTAITPLAMQSITFADPGAQQFGATPTLTASTSSGLTVSFSSSTPTVCAITTGGQLSFLMPGACTISASQTGDTSHSPATTVTRTFVVNAVAPGAPAIDSVAAGDGQVVVTFTAPGSLGGSAITGYTVTSIPGGITATGSGSPITITGLTNGTAYTFTVTATNAAGTSVASAASESVMPMAVQTINFPDPGPQSFGMPVTLVATVSSGLAAVFTSSTPTVCTISSGGVLTLISAGSCTVSAAQPGDASHNPATSVSRTFVVNAVAPDTPAISSIITGDGQATVSFTGPVNVGGSPVTGYTVTAMPGGITATGNGSFITITGLTNGTAYTFTVTATNVAGTSIASAPSAAVTPMAEQTITFADPGAQPFNTPLTLVATSSAGLTPSFTGTTPAVCTVTLTGVVTFVTAGTCTVKAEQAGDSAHNAAPAITRSFIVSAVAPDAPMIMDMVAGDAQVVVDFMAPADVGGSPVTVYTATAMPGDISVVGTSSPITVTGLVNGTRYTFTVTATNAAGTSQASPVSAAITPQAAQTITTNGPAPGTQEVGIPLALNATTSSGLVPVFSSATPGVCTINAQGVATFITEGTCTLHINQPGNESTAAAEQVTYTFTVNPQRQSPIVDAPADITINATALYTPISLRQLLSLATNTSPAEIETAMAQLARDSTDGVGCCAPRPQGLVNGDRILLRPGRHEVIWTATNRAGLSGSDVQVVNVRPLVSFSKNQVTVKGNTAPVRIILNGPSPFYPLQVPYVIDSSSTAAPGDYNLTNGIATFTEGQTEVTLNATFNSQGTPGNTQLVLALDDTSAASAEPLAGYDPVSADIHDINAGATSHHTISVIAGNVAPKTTLVVSQGGKNTILVAADGGPVTVTANVVDPNIGDTHSFNWSRTVATLVDTDGVASNSTFVFDPAGQSGLRYANVTTTDSAGASDTADIYFQVVAALPVLEAGVDTDEDGIDDLTEGTADTNGNGIPDYLDNMPSNNVLPQVIINTQSYLIECDPGVRCGVGQFALVGSSGGVQILDDELGETGNLIADPAFQPVGGIFDFVINDLPTAGQSVSIVIPQQAPIPANAVYRKFRNGQWVTFVTTANNSLHSTAGNQGYCPPPGSADWQPGLIEGYLCVQLTIEDGGPNDADATVNAAVVDPGAVSMESDIEEPEPPVIPPKDVYTKGSGSGSVDGLLLLALGMLLLGSRARKLVLLMALVATAASARADALEKTYIRIDVYQVEGNQSEEKFQEGMAGEGVNYTLLNYDVKRTGYQVAIGYSWTEYVYTELGYLDLGDVRVDLRLPGNTNENTFGEAFARHYPRTADGATLVQGVRMKINDHWSISPEIGVFIWSGDIEVNGASFTLDYDKNTDLLVGLRLDYQLSSHFGLGVGGRRIRFNDQDLDLWGVSGRFNF